MTNFKVGDLVKNRTKSSCNCEVCNCIDEKWIITKIIKPDVYICAAASGVTAYFYEHNLKLVKS